MLVETTKMKAIVYLGKKMDSSHPIEVLNENN